MLTVKDALRELADKVASLIAVVPRVAAYAVAATSTAADAARGLIDKVASLAVEVLDAAAAGLAKIADKLDELFGA